MNHQLGDSREEDYQITCSLPSNRLGEHHQDNNCNKSENEHIRLLHGVRSIIESYWSHFNIIISNEVIFVVTKLVTNYIDKLMKYASKLSNPRSSDHPLTTDNLISVLENDDRKLKRAQDVIRINRRKYELLSAFCDAEYTKHTSRDSSIV